MDDLRQRLRGLSTRLLALQDRVDEDYRRHKSIATRTPAPRDMRLTLDLPKGVDPLELLTLVNDKFDGVTLVTKQPAARPRVVKSNGHGRWFDQFTPAEADIIQKLGRGETVRSIAKHAQLKIGSVRSLIQNARERAGIKNLEELRTKDAKQLAT